MEVRSSGLRLPCPALALWAGDYRAFWSRSG